MTYSLLSSKDRKVHNNCYIFRIIALLQRTSFLEIQTVFKSILDLLMTPQYIFVILHYFPNKNFLQISKWWQFLMTSLEKSKRRPCLRLSQGWLFFNLVKSKDPLLPCQLILEVLAIQTALSQMLAFVGSKIQKS